MADPKESISFYRDGKAYAAKRAGGHITGDYEIVNDETVEGLRTIVLKETDKSAFLQKLDELVDALAKKLGEQKSRLFRQLLRDTLIDYDDKSIDRLYKKVVLGEEPVKAREGCFRIIVGDGRRRNCDKIILRE